MITLATLGKVARGIPLWLYAIGALLVGAWLWGDHRERIGAARVQAEWGAAVERGKIRLEKLKADAERVNTVVETRIEYRDRIITQKGEDRVLVKEVFVPTGSGMLDGGFRLFHDAAATDTVPDPARVADAAPVAAEDVADTLNYNYTVCHKAYARVAAWELWAQEISKLHGAE